MKIELELGVEQDRNCSGPQDFRLTHHSIAVKRPSSAYTRKHLCGGLLTVSEGLFIIIMGGDRSMVTLMVLEQ